MTLKNCTPAEPLFDLHAELSDTEYTALAVLLHKIKFADIERILGNDDPELIEYAHMALIELDKSLELATEQEAA